jgi:AraC-like DNA-binding protein
MTRLAPLRATVAATRNDGQPIRTAEIGSTWHHGTRPAPAPSVDAPAPPRHGRGMPRVSSALRARLARARALAQDGYDQPLTVTALADAAGLSPFHFVRTFRSAYGVTPHDFLTRVRLDRARERLALGDSVTEACMAVGFASLGSFSALFHREIGCAPSAYRRAVRPWVRGSDLAPLYVPFCFAAAYAAWIPPASRKDGEAPLTAG